MMIFFFIAPLPGRSPLHTPAVENAHIPPRRRKWIHICVLISLLFLFFLLHNSPLLYVLDTSFISHVFSFLHEAVNSVIVTLSASNKKKTNLKKKKCLK